MLRAINICKEFNDGDKKIKAVNNASIDFKENVITFIMGPSGCGKTTILNILGQILRPDSGSLHYNDEDIFKLSEAELASFRNKTIGYIFQMFYLEPNFSVIENVIMPLVISGVNKKERIQKAHEFLYYVGLDDKSNSITSKLSGGEKQRLCIARALINNPKIILADEPTGNLDSENSKIILDYLKKIAGEGKIVIVVSHNEEECKKYADRVYHMKDGIVYEN